MVVVVSAAAASSNDSNVSVANTTLPPPSLNAWPIKVDGSVSTMSQPNRGPGLCICTPNEPLLALNDSSKIECSFSG